jgi:four helix bundle protein
MHGPDRKRFLVIARGSLYDAEHWLGVASEQGLIASRDEEVAEIRRSLSGLIRRI